MLLVVWCFSCSASDLKISLSPQTNIHSYYFPDKASADGKVIHLGKSTTVCFDYRNTAFNNIGDFLSFGGYMNGCWTSFNINKRDSGLATIWPNIHDDCTHRFDGPIVYGTTNIWHSVAAAFTTNGTLYSLIYCCVDGKSYAYGSVGGSSSQAPSFHDLDISIIFTNTLTSVVTTNVEIRSILVIDTIYNPQTLSLLCLSDKSAFDVSRICSLTASNIRTNVTASLQFSTNNFQWTPLTPPLYFLTPYTNKTIKLTFPYFQQPIAVFRLKN